MAKRLMIILIVMFLFILGCKTEKAAPSQTYTPPVVQEPVKQVPVCNCVGEQQCVNGTCKDPVCVGCTYLDQASHKCEKYECCSDSSCASGEKCSYHKCAPIECGACEYSANHACAKYKCCKNSDCDDDDDSTDDTCKNAGTTSAQCLHENTGDCGASLSCFTDFLEDCKESKVTLGLKSEDSKWEWDYGLSLEILGEEDDGCKIIMKMVNISVDMTNDYEDQLDEEGKTNDEIDQILEDKEDEAADYEGDKKTCYIDMDRLDDVTDTLTSWKDDDEFTVDEFDCDSLT